MLLYQLTLQLVLCISAPLSAQLPAALIQWSACWRIDAELSDTEHVNGLPAYAQCVPGNTRWHMQGVYDSKRNGLVCCPGLLLAVSVHFASANTLWLLLLLPPVCGAQGDAKLWQWPRPRQGRVWRQKQLRQQQVIKRGGGLWLRTACLQSHHLKSTSTWVSMP